jgi:hypothetical protein
VPIDTRKAPQTQREMVPYSLPVLPHRQLTKRDLGAFDVKLLDSIEAVANSASYLGDVSHRNDLIFDTELRTSNAPTAFFRDGGVTDLQPGYDLSRNDRAWVGVSNTVFFDVIRMAWNNFTQITGGDQSGSSSVRTTLRNAGVVWLENWIPSVYIGPVPRVEMTFDHAEVLDIRARARTLQRLIRWEDEGAVVERWIEKSLSAKDGRKPSRLALAGEIPQRALVQGAGSAGWA